MQLEKSLDPDFRTLIWCSVWKINIKCEFKRQAQHGRFWWFHKQTALKRLYLICALLTTVSAGYVLKKSEVQRKDVRSVGPFFSPPTQHWTYLPYSSFRHTLPERCLCRMLQIWQKTFHLRVLLEWLYYCSCSAKRSPHEAKREHVGEERTKPVSPTHTLSAQQPKRTPLLPYLKRCQGLMPCQKQAHFHQQSQEAFGKEELRCCFRTEHLVHKHSVCKAEKHGNGIMGGCGAFGKCSDQHMELQLLTRKDPPPRYLSPAVLH